MNIDKKLIGYVSNNNLLGEVVKIDFFDLTFTIKNGYDEYYVVHNSDVEIFEEVGKLGNVTIFHKDVLGDINGQLYEVELCDDKKVSLHLLDKNLERESVSGEPFDFEVMKTALAEVLSLQGNLYELRHNMTPQFNINAVKESDGKSYTYYYACNNKAEKQIDLIRVTFVGASILEEDYHRKTVSYDDYQQLVETSKLVEVSHWEFKNFMTGVMYGTNGKIQGTDTKQEDKFDESVNFKSCDCIDEKDHCDGECDLW